MSPDDVSVDRKGAWGGMRRLPVFALLGPLSCWLLVVAGAWIVFGVGPLDEGWQMFVAMLFGTFGVVLPFMLALAWVDGRLSRFRWRIPAVALVAFGVSVAGFFELTRGSSSAANWGYFWRWRCRRRCVRGWGDCMPRTRRDELCLHDREPGRTIYIGVATA